MDDSTLKVDPEKLRHADQALTQLHGDIRYELGRIHTDHSDLQDTWQGAAADLIATSWDTLHTELGAHTDQLAGFAQNLRTSANAFTGQDADFASGIGKLGLDLPPLDRG
ncbi:WXG100 family type VII secretion target [Nocardia stercoris]|uniref:WXG100 family type VII secretion target n=1 Tax=Nocardia stercoris TaxID=2483361 RepID=UPI001319F559|nr:WXG100 family type VII secretion target [Nocardia stercoris]